MGFKCYFLTVGIFLSVALILAIWICCICVPSIISICIFFISIFRCVLLWAEDLYGNFLVCQFSCMYFSRMFASTPIEIFYKNSYRNFHVWQLKWQLYGFYKENFHRSTCFLIDLCPLIICFLLYTPILSYFNHL